MKTRKSTELRIEAEANEDGVWFRWGKLTLHLSAREDPDETKYVRVFVTSADELTGKGPDGEDICIPVEGDGLSLEVR